MKSKKRAVPDVTARPKSLADEMEGISQGEPGLSIDADELALRFLDEATETGTRRRPEKLSLGDASPSDDPLPGPNFDSDQSVWENTMDLGVHDDEVQTSALEVEEEDARDSAITLDLTQDSIREASLLDREVGETGEVESPVLVTEDHQPHVDRDDDDESDEAREPPAHRSR